jgi:putative ABC transport system permease protein
MTFLAFIVRNLSRQRMRTTLTVLGIGVGITTVVALGAISGGMRETAGAILRSGGGDFIVAQKGSADLTFSSLSTSEWQTVAETPGVARATGVLMHISRQGKNPYFLLQGVRADQLAAAPPKLEAGRTLAPAAADEMLLGARAARDLDKQLGSKVRFDGMPLTVVGIYSTGVVFYDSGAYAPLPTVQQIARKPGLVTTVSVVVSKGADRRVVARLIEKRDPGLTTVLDASEYGKVDQGVEAIDAGDLAISLLAVILGAIGVMNTMIMSVYERTREIGILRAVGWRSSRIIRMIVGESLVLCGIAAALGIGLGVLATRALLLVPAIRSFLEPEYTWQVALRALAVAAVVGVGGALYPALRAVRLSPMEALRHE